MLDFCICFRIECSLVNCGKQAGSSQLCSCYGARKYFRCEHVSYGQEFTFRLLNGRQYQVIETVATKNIGIAEGIKWIEQELKKVFCVC